MSRCLRCCKDDTCCRVHMLQISILRDTHLKKCPATFRPDFTASEDNIPAEDRYNFLLK